MFKDVREEVEFQVSHLCHACHVSPSLKDVENVMKIIMETGNSFSELFLASLHYFYVVLKLEPLSRLVTQGRFPGLTASKGGLCIPPGVKHARFQVINGFQHGGHAEFCPIFDLIFSPGKAVMVSQTF